MAVTSEISLFAQQKKKFFADYLKKGTTSTDDLITFAEKYSFHVVQQEEESSVLSQAKPLLDELQNAQEPEPEPTQQGRYAFAYKHRSFLQQEFQDLLDSVDVLKDENSEKPFLALAISLSLLLENYYRVYGQRAAAKEQEDKRQECLRRLRKEAKEPDLSFFAALRKYIKDSIKALITFPLHPSKIRDFNAFSNIFRLLIVFTRLSNTELLLLLQQADILEKLDRVLGTVKNVDQVIAQMQTTSIVLLPYSVAAFLLRGIYNAAMVGKHTFWVSEQEQEVARWQRFWDELKKRDLQNINDGAWALVNFFANYNYVLGISTPVAVWLTAGFLVFDMTMFLWCLKRAHADYLVKRNNYDQQITDCERLITSCKVNGDAKQQEFYENNLKVLQCQLQYLEKDWQVNKEKLMFLLGGAALLMLGFSLAFAGTPGLPVCVGFFMAMTGVALYLSGNAFANYRKASTTLDLAERLGKDTSQLTRDNSAAFRELLFTLLKNIVFPTTLVVTFTVFWPAAIALAGVYVAAEVGHQCWLYKTRHPQAGFFKSSAAQSSGEDSSHAMMLDGQPQPG